MIDVSTSNGVKSAQPKEKIELIGVLEHARRGINRPANGLGVKPKMVSSVGKGLLFLSDTQVWSLTSITKGNAN